MRTGYWKELTRPEWDGMGLSIHCWNPQFRRGDCADAHRTLIARVYPNNKADGVSAEEVERASMTAKLMSYAPLMFELLQYIGNALAVSQWDACEDGEDVKLCLEVLREITGNPEWTFKNGYTVPEQLAKKLEAIEKAMP